MKNLRHALLILLMLLLPLRGAVAAAALCPLADAAPATAMATNPSMVAGPAGHAMGAHRDAADQGAGAEADHGAGHHADSHDKCNLCSACCAATPLMSTVPAPFEPLAAAAVGFPALQAAAPSFIVTGPERPPRSV